MIRILPIRVLMAALGLVLVAEASLDPVFPNLKLSQYHDGCNAANKSRGSDCVAAAHRFCMYTHPSTFLGVPQEVRFDAFGILCGTHAWFGDVPYTQIPACGSGDSQSAQCYSALHRYCDGLGLRGRVMGVAQEVTATVAGVGCIKLDRYEAVKMTELRKHYPRCNDPAKGQSPDCIGAVRMHCVSRGYKGGLVAELGLDELGVGCVGQGDYYWVDIGGDTRRG